MSVTDETPISTGETTDPTQRLRTYHHPEHGRQIGRLCPPHAPGNAIALPEPGDLVRIDSGDSAIGGVWIGLKAPINGAQVTARLLHQGRVETHQVGIRQLQADSIVVGTTDHRVQEATRALQSIYAAADQTAIDQQKWKDELVTSAHRYADDNELCPKFDDFMDEWDLPRRMYDYSVMVEVTLKLPVMVSGHDDDEAEDAVSHEMITDALADGSDISELNWAAASTVKVGLCQ